MPKRITKPAKPESALPPDYAPLLEDIKARVQAARVKAGLAANRELLALYWDIGRLILERRHMEGWGTKVIDRLSADLQKAFPGRQGFSPRNLKYMRAFAEARPQGVFVQQAGAQIAGGKNSGQPVVQAPLAHPRASNSSIVQAPLAQLTWYHNLTLLEKVKSPAERLWYAHQSIQNA